MTSWASLYGYRRSPLSGTSVKPQRVHSTVNNKWTYLSVRTVGLRIQVGRDTRRLSVDRWRHCNICSDPNSRVHRTPGDTVLHTCLTMICSDNHAIKPGLHVTFLHRFSHVLKWVQCIPLVLFTHDVTKCKKAQRCCWQKRAKNVRCIHTILLRLRFLSQKMGCKGFNPSAYIVPLRQ